MTLFVAHVLALGELACDSERLIVSVLAINIAVRIRNLGHGHVVRENRSVRRRATTAATLTAKSKPGHGGYPKPSAARVSIRDRNFPTTATKFPACRHKLPKNCRNQPPKIAATKFSTNLTHRN